MSTVTKKDPRVYGPKSKCAVCKGERPEAAVADGDPFCSVVCCHAFHGVEIQVKTPGRPVGASA